MKRFANYEIEGCREYEKGTDNAHIERCDDAEAEFWTLYGRVNGEGVRAITDHATREEAEEMLYLITGVAANGRIVIPEEEFNSI